MKLKWRRGWLLVLLLAAPVTWGQASEDDEQRARTIYRMGEIVEVKPDGGAEAAMKVYNEAGGGGVINEKVMAAMYEAAGGGEKAFKTVALLIDKGLDPDQIKNPQDMPIRQISNDHSIDMAKIREARIETSIGAVIERYAGEGRQVRVARSDSGNVTSGMKSDLDQTFYLEEYKKGLGWVRVVAEDGKFISAFGEEWGKLKPKLSMAALDVASFEGRDRFPDPMNTKISFEAEFRRVTGSVRATPGAYTYQGAVAQQMQFRALEAILDSNERAYQTYEVEDGKVKKMPFDKEVAIKRMFGNQPRLLPAHTYGAAVANLLELQKYMKKTKFESKYHLRVWEDSMFPHNMDEASRKAKIEYIKTDPAERAEHNDAIADKMFTDPKKRKLHKLALEVSADLRLINKGDFDKVSVGALPADPKARDAAVFEKLAKAAYDIEGKPTPEQIKAAVDEHRQLAAEFCLEAVHKTSVEAFRMYNDPEFRKVDVDRYKHLMTGVSDADWPKVRENLRTAAHITLLYSIYDLGPRKSWDLLNRLNSQFPDMRFVDKVALWARGQVQPIEGALRDVTIREEFYARQMARVAELHQRVQQHVGMQLGFHRVGDAEKINGFLIKANLAWTPSRLARNMFMDPGSIDALAQIVRVYVESKGDLEATKAKALDELILSVPVGGQIVSLSRAAQQGLLPGIQGVVFMAGAIQFPVFGHIPRLVCERIGSAHVVGVDLSENMLAIARRHLANSPFGDRIEYRPADAKGLDFPNSAFDTVFSNTILHHIPDPRKFIVEALRVLKVGGVLLIRDLFRPPDEPTLDSLVATYAGNDTPHQRQMFCDSLHAALTPDELRTMVADLDVKVAVDTDRHVSIQRPAC